MPLLLKILPLVLYAVSLITALPIISKPLENNPDHLVWEALLTIDTRHMDPDKTRKVPKSIFITPNLNESKIPCPSGHKLGPDGKCYKTLNIDPLDILKTQIASLFNRNHTSIDYDEYDYSDYNESTESMGDAAGTIEPYDVPLSLGFADETTTSSLLFPTHLMKNESKIVFGNNYDDKKYKQPFLVSTVDVVKSYDDYVDRSKTSEIDTLSTAQTSTTSTANEIIIGGTETSSNATSFPQTTGYTTSQKAISGSTNNMSDVIATTPTATTYSEHPIAMPSSSFNVEKENITSTYNMKTEKVQNVKIFHEFSHPKAEYDGHEIEEMFKSPNSNEHLPFSTKATPVKHSSQALPVDLSIATGADGIVTAKLIDADTDTAIKSSSSAIEHHLAASLHRFSIFSTTTTNSVSTSPTASYNVENPTPLLDGTFEKPSGSDINDSSVLFTQVVNGVDGIEIVRKDEISSLADDIDGDIDIKTDDNQFFTSRLAEELLFQGISAEQLTNYNESKNIYSRNNIENTTQLNTLNDIITTTEELDKDTAEYEPQLNLSSGGIIVPPPIFNESFESFSSPEKFSLESNRESSSSMYTTIINSLLQTRRTINANEDNNVKVVIQTGTTFGNMYRIVTTTDTPNQNGIENEPTINLSPANAKQSETPISDAHSENNQTIRLGKNCYLKNYLEHYYIMCT